MRLKKNGEPRKDWRSWRASDPHKLARSSWQNMIQRCYNPKNHQFKDYGGRGIKCCISWRRFKNFLKDMGDRPEGTTLDRIDNNKGYNKSNCRWATWEEQVKGKRMRAMGSSKTQGVYFEEQSQRWKGVVYKNNKKVYLGCSIDEQVIVNKVLQWRKENEC